MIRIILEEPIAYAQLPYKDEFVWIYKNPNRKEVEGLLEPNSYYILRMIINGNDYYVAEAYSLTHADIAKKLTEVGELSNRRYTADFIIDTNNFTVGTGYGGAPIGGYESFKVLQKFLPNMTETGLLGLDYWVEDLVENPDEDAEEEFLPVTLGELMDMIDDEESDTDDKN